MGVISQAFPCGVPPGYNPAHVGSRSVLFSAVSDGPNFLELVGSNPGAKGTLAGAPASNMHGLIGPATKFAATTDAVQFPGRGTESFTSLTFAAVVISTGAGRGIVQLGNIGSGPFLFITVSQFLALANIASTLVLTSNVPYFVAASGNAGSSNFVTKNLNTGVTLTASGTAPSLGSDAATWVIGQGNGTTQPWIGSIAAVMAANSFLSVQELQLFAADPWSFWYPQ